MLRGSCLLMNNVTLSFRDFLTQADTAVFLDNKPKAVDFDPAQLLFYPCNTKLASLLAQPEHNFDRPRWDWGSWRSATVA